MAEEENLFDNVLFVSGDILQNEVYWAAYYFDCDQGNICLRIRFKGDDLARVWTIPDPDWGD